MTEENKSGNGGSKGTSKEQSHAQEYFEGKSRAGNEGVLFQPTGSHETDPFAEPSGPANEPGSDPGSSTSPSAESSPASDSGADSQNAD